MAAVSESSLEVSGIVEVFDLTWNLEEIIVKFARYLMKILNSKESLFFFVLLFYAAFKIFQNNYYWKSNNISICFFI